jgi:hypothetical protein
VSTEEREGTEIKSATTMEGKGLMNKHTWVASSPTLHLPAARHGEAGECALSKPPRCAECGLVTGELGSRRRGGLDREFVLG